MTTAIKTTAVFLQPFELASFNETLPAGEYEVETVPLDPVDRIEPGGWTSCVLVHLHARASHPGLSRTVTVPLTELERAIARDKLSGKALTDFFLEEKLADPMIRLVMQADGVSDTEVRGAYFGRNHSQAGGDETLRVAGPIAAIKSHDGVSPRPGSSRPGIGE